MPPQTGAAERVLWVAVVAACLGVAALVPLRLLRGGSDGSPVVISISPTSFTPGEVVVRRGTAVVFRNADLAPHNLISMDGREVDSGLLPPGSAFRVVADGPFAYQCLIHPQLRGKIVLTG